MAIIRVKNNHTGDEGAVDESWLTRWPEDFTRIPDEAPAKSAKPSSGTDEENK